MRRRVSRLLTVAGFALASASVVLWWRAPSPKGPGEFALRRGAGDGIEAHPGPQPGRGTPSPDSAMAQAVGTQALLRQVDRASAASGVRVGTANVRTAKTDSEAPLRSRTDLQISGAGPYRAVKNLTERLLQSDSSLALDRVSFTRTADTTGDLDVELSFHKFDLPGR